jgi:galactose-1-phosphate uridylyltransferase
LNNIITTDYDIQNFLSENNYAGAVRALLQEQKKNWKALAEGYGSLEKIENKTFPFDGFKIEAQHNPGRIASSSAKVDSDSIKNRKCFLCQENLPEEQKGILYNNEFIILCNPFPIFPEHFTVSNIKHTPQEIKNSFGSLLMLAKDLSEYYTVFYNGPACGASAPDHLHFQAATKNFMPVDREFDRMKKEYGEILSERENLTSSIIDDGLRRFISFESNEAGALKNSFENFYEIYSEISENEKEPMMNILAYYDKDSRWRIIIFLREKHRPSFYFEKGENNFLWSPAAVDLGGICIIPLEKDFKKISKRIIITGFNEITISAEKFSFIKEKLRKL